MHDSRICCGALWAVRETWDDIYLNDVAFKLYLSGSKLLASEVFVDLTKITAGRRRLSLLGADHGGLGNMSFKLYWLEFLKIGVTIQSQWQDEWRDWFGQIIDRHESW